MEEITCPCPNSDSGLGNVSKRGPWCHGNKYAGKVVTHFESYICSDVL